jgi:hypothetical protein
VVERENGERKARWTARIAAGRQRRERREEGVLDGENCCWARRAAGSDERLRDMFLYRSMSFFFCGALEQTWSAGLLPSKM